MLQILAETHPMMVIAITFVALVYVTGLWLVVVAVLDKRVWVEDENGELRQVPESL